jgi:hypothetical protein
MAKYALQRKLKHKFGRILHTYRLCILVMATRRTEGELQVVMIGLGRFAII